MSVAEVDLFSFNGWGVSLIDGLDTMWIMGLQEEFLDSMPTVANMTFVLTLVSMPPSSMVTDTHRRAG